MSGTDPEKEQIAQEKFGKSFEELEGRERVIVGGTKGGRHRKEQMAEEGGGDPSKAYAEMGKTGGQAQWSEGDKGGTEFQRHGGIGADKAEKGTE